MATTTSENSSSDDNFYGSRRMNSDFAEVNRKDSGRVQFSEDEEELLVRMYKLVGERWTLIAGRIPGRSAEEVEKYWVSRCAANGFSKQ